MNTLVQIVRQFDVVLIQEIRDASETTAPIFLDAINAVDGPEYAYIRSERLGRSNSKKAYAYFYNTESVQYLASSALVYNDVNDVFEREPYIASFRAGGFDFTLISIHTKPERARNVEGMGPERNIIALGDFNVDGAYYDEDSLDNLLMDYGYYWVISNEVDTMTKTNWTYDRMVMTDYTYSSEYIQNRATVYRFDTYGLNQTFTEEVSDHYPIYAEFSTTLPDDD